MAVYVDAAIWAWSGLKWCHLLADDLDELHRFAANLGIKRSSFQCPPKAATPHYDLTGYERARRCARRCRLQPRTDHCGPPPDCRETR